ncbi:MAG: hypothetical protein U5J98_06920 [Halobacteriales archaeon]|nr:hypothetical protein [Halobacteriales archaeon]
MYSDLISNRDAGTGLMYEGGRLFSLYNWKNLSRTDHEHDCELHIEFGEPEWDDDDGDDGPTCRVRQHHLQAVERRRRGPAVASESPARATSSVFTGNEVEPLASPLEDWKFDGIREVGGERLVSMTKAGSEGETAVVARVPVRDFGLNKELGGEGA